MNDRTYVSIPYLAGTDGDVSVTFINATFQQKEDLTKRFPDPDFGAWLIDDLHNKKKYLLLKQASSKKSHYAHHVI